MNRAGASREAVWELIEHEGADIVLLQEVTGIPNGLLNTYQCHLITPRYFEGHHAPFSTAILSKGMIDAAPFLKSNLEWVNRIHAECHGWIVGCETELVSGGRFRVLSVHSPAGPIPSDRWPPPDAAGIKLTNNPDLWFTEILWSLMRDTKEIDDGNWIVGGDFNASVLFDSPKDRGNRQVLQRLKSIGLTECLSSHCGAPVPTFMDTQKSVKHQLDYCFVGDSMARRLVRARVPCRSSVFTQSPRLSDHLPVVCEFE